MAKIGFTAARDFFSEETQSQYVAGLSYRAGVIDRVLLALLPRWQADGKIVMGGTTAQLNGKGMSQ
jgi:hypothetical protein